MTGVPDMDPDKLSSVPSSLTRVIFNAEYNIICIFYPVELGKMTFGDWPCNLP